MKMDDAWTDLPEELHDALWEISEHGVLSQAALESIFNYMDANHVCGYAHGKATFCTALALPGEKFCRTHRHAE